MKMLQTGEMYNDKNMILLFGFYVKESMKHTYDLNSRKIKVILMQPVTDMHRLELQYILEYKET